MRAARQGVATYRSGPLQNVVVYLTAAALTVIALATIFSDPAGGIVLMATAMTLVALQVSNRLVVSASGLSWRYGVRTTTLGWDQVRAVDVCPGQSFGGWWSPRIDTGSTLLRITCVLGTRAYAERVVAEIRAARPTQPDPEISSSGDYPAS
jgi:hypothetical protein